MVVHYLYVRGVPTLPCEANAPLVIDANTILPFTVSSQLFQAITLDCRQIAQLPSGMEHFKFPLRSPLYRPKPLYPLPPEQPFRVC